MKRFLLAFCAILILASQAVGGLVGGTNAAAITGLATEHNYLSHPQWEELAEALKTECPDGNEACKEGVYERYRKISEKQEEEFAQCVLSGGDCSEHLEAIAGVNAHALAQKYGLDISDLHNSEALANLVDIQGKDSLNLMFTNSASYDVKDAQNFSASNCSGVTASACLAGYRKKIRLESEARVLAAAGIVIDFIPIAGDLKAIYDCGNQPDISTCSAMIAGIVPGIGDGASLLIRKGDDIIDSTNITKRVDDIGDTNLVDGVGDTNVTPVVISKMPQELTFEASSGVKLIVDPDKTTTVLGNYGQDMQHILSELDYPKTLDFGEKKGGFNVLNVPDSLNKNPDQFWNDYNKPFLDEAIKRGDNFPLATKPEFKVLNRELPDGTFERRGFGREYDYLISKGYRYDTVTSSMVKP